MISVGRKVRTLLTAGAFAAFYCGAAIFSWIWLPLVARGGVSRADQALRSQALVRQAFILFHDFMRVGRLLDFDPRRVDLRLPEGPCVVIANHPTLVDVTALIAAGGPMCAVVKPELSNSVAFGRLLRHCWHIESTGEDDLGASPVVDEAITRLKAGLRILIFPEGTRSPERGLRRFRRGAFEIAARAGVPVVPLLLGCDPPILSKLAPWHRTPETVPRLTVTRLPALAPEAWADAATMASEVRAGYARLLNDGAFEPATGAWDCGEPRGRLETAADRDGHRRDMLLVENNMGRAKDAVVSAPGDAKGSIS